MKLDPKIKFKVVDGVRLVTSMPKKYYGYYKLTDNGLKFIESKSKKERAYARTWLSWEINKPIYYDNEEDDLEIINCKAYRDLFK